MWNWINYGLINKYKDIIFLLYHYFKVGGDIMPKCGVCNKGFPEQPKITEEGTCSVCGAKLKPA